MKLVIQQKKTGPSDYVVKFLEPDYITEHAMAVDTLAMLYINYNYKMNISQAL